MLGCDYSDDLVKPSEYPPVSLQPQKHPASTAGEGRLSETLSKTLSIIKAHISILLFLFDALYESKREDEAGPTAYSYNRK